MKRGWVRIAAGVALSAWLGCSNGGDAPSDRVSAAAPTPTPTPAEDTPTPTPDRSACREALNAASANCGAQFLTGAGVVIPQNELLAACGQSKVECVASCWEADGECEAFQSCLADRCDLE